MTESLNDIFHQLSHYCITDHMYRQQVSTLNIGTVNLLPWLGCGRLNARGRVGH